MSTTKSDVSQILSSTDSANYLKCAESTLRQSRVSGLLLGVSAPKYLKMGNTIRYKLSTLDVWLEQFNEKENTAQK